MGLNKEGGGANYIDEMAEARGGGGSFHDTPLTLKCIVIIIRVKL